MIAMKWPVEALKNINTDSVVFGTESYKAIRYPMIYWTTKIMHHFWFDIFLVVGENVFRLICILINRGPEL